MGIAPQDRIESLCRNDMDAIERDVAAIKAAMKKVDEMMPRTWTGKDADHWRTAYEARMKQLKHLFETFPTEEKQLVEQARRKQEKLDQKMHGGHV
ncbi:hypothetical protein [Streptomyces natalensis]|uniref:Uncharacterized protein n=1 Tax=Streptomyces natalensis ATCC 27448 TaxID=1240678 RepID=A0A0D7CJ27_9ACTN|nr:hypothetical protein [Streptomyces natalensis]KIZ15427.1 hypothetical protein SNA_28155 [Streptomyces natalensis ATCC 27448]